MKRCAALAVLACGCASSRVDLVAQNGDVFHTYSDVTWATTPDERAQGLIGHAPLNDDQAMVLDYPVVDQACITNQAVDFPITAIFVDGKSAIVAVESLDAHDTRIPCHDGVLDVIETNAGGASIAADAATVAFSR